MPAGADLTEHSVWGGRTVQARMLAMLGEGSKRSHETGSTAHEDTMRAIQSGAVAAGLFTFANGASETKKLREAARAWQAMNPATVSDTRGQRSWASGALGATLSWL